MTTPTDPFDLSRFVDAQDGVYERALAEIARGRKTSHWIWFIFPQFAGLWTSSMSRRYAIHSRAEARAYLGHRVLGPRLIECCRAMLAVNGRSANEIFDAPDDEKVQACATLFELVSTPDSVFALVLDRYYAGARHTETVRMVEVTP